MRTRSRRNPFRRVAGVETKTWLPDDAGKFTDPDAEVVREFVPSDRNARGWEECVVLPDGHRVPLVLLGEGGWAKAFKGDDGWVYLFSFEDPSKELLVEATRETVDAPFAIHLPWIERIGRTRRRFVEAVYRMPMYGPPYGEANLLAYRLSLVPYILPSGMDVDEKTLQRVVRSEVKDVRSGFGDHPLVVEAVEYLAQKMGRMENRMVFEFPMRNLAQDIEGNLVLLDVVYQYGSPGRYAMGEES